MKHVRGSANVAINQYLSYYNVRMKPVPVMAGQEVQIKVRPTYHMVSPIFEQMSLESRKCLLKNEVKVGFQESCGLN